MTAMGKPKSSNIFCKLVGEGVVGCKFLPCVIMVCYIPNVIPRKFNYAVFKCALQLKIKK